MNGFGVFIWPDGRRYEGEYLDDKKHGKGVFTFSDGKKYSGLWVNGKQHGEGEFTNVDGTVRIGLWENGKKIKWLDSTYTSIVNPIEEEKNVLNEYDN